MDSLFLSTYAFFGNKQLQFDHFISSVVIFLYIYLFISHTNEHQTPVSSKMHPLPLPAAIPYFRPNSSQTSSHSLPNCFLSGIASPYVQTTPIFPPSPPSSASNPAILYPSTLLLYFLTLTAYIGNTHSTPRRLPALPPCTSHAFALDPH